MRYDQTKTIAVHGAAALEFSFLVAHTNTCMCSTAAGRLEVRPLSRLFKALGDETRVRIVALLTHGKLCVCHLEAALALPQPTVSRQLAVLRNAGVVEATRKGQWVHYGLAEQNDPDCRQQLRALVRGFARRAVLRRDVERLLKVRGPEACEQG